MKEKELEKCLDNLIIRGLIKEAEQDNAEFETAMREMSDKDFHAMISGAAPKKRNVWKIWTGAIASAAAILLIVLIPAVNNMHSRVCESALVALSAYWPATKGADISTMSEEEVRNLLPELEKQYYVAMHPDQEPAGKGADGNSDYYLEHTDALEAGPDLAAAYLRLEMKDKAVEILKELAAKDENPDFSEHCIKILDILE